MLVVTVPVNVGDARGAAPKLVRAAEAVVAPVPPLATGNVPVTPVDKGNPVALVSIAEVGVPSAGVVNVGLVKVLLVSVSLPARVAKVPVVGNVILVVFVEVKFVVYAPVVVRLPPSVIVFPVLATPVPPFAPNTIPVTFEDVPVVF